MGEVWKDFGKGNGSGRWLRRWAKLRRVFPSTPRRIGRSAVHRCARGVSGAPFQKLGSQVLSARRMVSLSD